MTSMKLTRRQFKKCLPFCGWLLAGSVFSGCSHLYYADPNSQSSFVFPGAGQTTVAGSQNPTTPGPLAGSPLAPVGRAPVPAPSTPAMPAGPGSTVSDILRTGDSIIVSFSDIPPPGILPVIQQIRGDGKITLPHNVALIAAGKTVGQLQDEIRAAYVPKLYVDLTASVKREQLVFFVDGEVKLSGRLPYQGEMTVLRAITSAGGFTDFANRKNVEVRRTTGQKVTLNWYKAIEDGRLDLPVFANDQIIVHKKLW